MKSFVVETKTYERSYRATDFPPEDAALCVAWFQQKLAEIPAQHVATAKIEIGCDVCYDAGTPTIEISYRRQETDSEEAHRESAAWKARTDAESRERATFRQLRAKYGDGA